MLVIVSTGFAPAGKVAETMPSACSLSSLRFVVPPSAVNLFDSVFWYDVLRISAAGSQMRVTPDGFSTSTRAVTSYVFQPLEDAVSASIGTAFEMASPAHTAPVDRRNSRLFIESSNDKPSYQV